MGIEHTRYSVRYVGLCGVRIEHTRMRAGTLLCKVRGAVWGGNRGDTHDGPFSSMLSYVRQVTSGQWCVKVHTPPGNP